MENIFISNFKNDWWDALTYTQQVEYLKKYPNSKFKVNKSILSLLRFESKRERALRLRLYLKNTPCKEEALDHLDDKLVSISIINLINQSSINTKEQHDSWSESSFKSWYDSLSKKEIASLITYKSEMYQEINEYLRGNFKVDSDKYSFLVKHIRNIDSAINKGVLNNDMYVYRGISLHRNLLNNLENKIIKENSFLSVTTRPIVASNFYGTKSNSALLKIRLIKGMPVASLNKGLDRDRPENIRYVENQEESELLLPRNSKLLVLSIKKNRKDYAPPNYLIECDLLLNKFKSI